MYGMDTIPYFVSPLITTRIFEHKPYMYISVLQFIVNAQSQHHSFYQKGFGIQK